MSAPSRPVRGREQCCTRIWAGDAVRRTKFSEMPWKLRGVALAPASACFADLPAFRDDSIVRVDWFTRERSQVRNPPRPYTTKGPLWRAFLSSGLCVEVSSNRCERLSRPSYGAKFSGLGGDPRVSGGRAVGRPSPYTLHSGLLHGRNGVLHQGVERGGELTAFAAFEHDGVDL